ncbi:hypothetical protein ETU10_07245 [Apibacter muscae]|uniref:hypothetical protein n=1 Tax=Apibacter muscae TaxID=2509004 RepID=UPI0011AD0C28|nr:hypothetical protein [Apibacter muscae]TWP23511.1 hypothetical protein ETU10_07245 [Apibacter muscae]
MEIRVMPRENISFIYIEIRDKEKIINALIVLLQQREAEYLEDTETLRLILELIKLLNQAKTY